MNNQVHVPVLLNEVIKFLNVKKNGIYCDFTIGYGGHSLAILKKLDKGQLIGFDQDLDAIKYCQLNLKNNQLILINDNFVNFEKYLMQLNIKNIDGALLDLGVSSFQLDNSKRGFSFRKNGPFDMRMNQQKGLTAAEYIRNNSLSDLINIFKKYGEINHSYHVAKAIKRYIDNNVNVSTLAIENIINKNLSSKKKIEKKHSVRLFFQAIRIAVNDELNVLDNFLKQIPKYLNKNGILAIITFHSLEEKIVKKHFNKWIAPPNLPGVPIDLNNLVLFKKIVNKPILPTENEKLKNPRSRSAKLFLIQKKGY